MIFLLFFFLCSKFNALCICRGGKAWGVFSLELHSTRDEKARALVRLRGLCELRRGRGKEGTPGLLQGSSEPWSRAQQEVQEQRCSCL